MGGGDGQVQHTIDIRISKNVLGTAGFGDLVLLGLHSRFFHIEAGAGNNIEDVKFPAGLQINIADDSGSYKSDAKSFHR